MEAVLNEVRRVRYGRTATTVAATLGEHDVAWIRETLEALHHLGLIVIWHGRWTGTRHYARAVPRG